MTGELLDYVLARAVNQDDFERWVEQGRATGWCKHPIRLTGHTTTVHAETGEIVSSYRTDEEPDGTLLKSCGSRRATTCESCAATYRADAYQLIIAGLRGGKGVTPEVATCPAVFVTLTAPTFGPVHSQRRHDGHPRPCRPGPTGRCRHDRPQRCSLVHATDDDRLGEPLCPDCFDYRGAILWNAHATPLWSRTTIALRRALGSDVDVSYAKVVEYQRRGVIHIHAVIRADTGTADATTLAVALRQVASTTSVPFPPGFSGAARWGDQIDIRPIGDGVAPPNVVAAYIAKYATKSTDAVGRLDHRLHAGDLDTLAVGPHLKRLVRTAWELGGDPLLEHLRLRAWAHTLGFRGHWLTKSRHYSTTLGALRTARATYAAERNGESTGDTVTAVKEWHFIGRGWANPGDRLLAATKAKQRTTARHEARSTRRAEAVKHEAETEPDSSGGDLGPAIGVTTRSER